MDFYDDDYQLTREEINESFMMEIVEHKREIRESIKKDYKEAFREALREDYRRALQNSKNNNLNYITIT